jgi:hypothetical protein
MLSSLDIYTSSDYPFLPQKIQFFKTKYLNFSTFRLKPNSCLPGMEVAFDLGLKKSVESRQLFCRRTLRCSMA